MWKLFAKIRQTPLATEPFGQVPPAPAGARSAPRLRAGGVTDCDAWAGVCPTGALACRSGALRLDLAACLMCGACADACPAAIVQTGEYALATRDRRRLAGEAAAAGDLPAREQARIRAVLGRSAHIRHVDAGSCNGCDWELTHLLNPVYDLQRFGIDFVASPRHADMLLVTGGVTRHLQTALQRTYDAAGEPKLVVAVGTCAISGGMIGRTYANYGGVDQVLPVAVYVPGCPPRPEAILHGILLALGRMEERAVTGA